MRSRGEEIEEALKAACDMLARLRPSGHDGDEDGGCYGDCLRCAYDATEAQVNAALARPAEEATAPAEDVREACERLHGLYDRAVREIFGHREATPTNALQVEAECARRLKEGDAALAAIYRSLPLPTGAKEREEVVEARKNVAEIAKAMLHKPSANAKPNGNAAREKMDRHIADLYEATVALLRAEAGGA